MKALPPCFDALNDSIKLGIVSLLGDDRCIRQFFLEIVADRFYRL